MYPKNLKREDYIDFPDDHFNNSGHEKYANFILESIKNI
jgi:hypothetical protein